MNSGDIHLVLGISCSGKSTFIEHQIESGVWSGLPVLMAYDLEPGLANLPKEECIIHYNLFRPFDNDAKNLSNNFLDDNILADLLKHKERFKATLLVLHPSVLSKRVLLQKEVEGSLRKTDTPYPHRNIFELLCRIEPTTFYTDWINLLGENGIDVSLISSETSDYTILDSAQSMTEYLNEDKSISYFDAEINHIIESNDFEYQKIQLGSTLFTEGDDRSPSLTLLDDDLSGKSLLDIGCAYGYFCFEAEKRNASRVVGTELKRHRYIGANIVKQINGSKAQFEFVDVLETAPGETYDIVLLLNVLHHLKEPVRALRLLASLCTEKLIIEFPTLADAKFRSTIDQSDVDQTLPLIGVSLQGEIDQTFLFSPHAIERILLDHDTLFSKIDFMESPMNKERCVAICYK